jgi:hypothetical protein
VRRGKGGGRRGGQEGGTDLWDGKSVPRGHEVLCKTNRGARRHGNSNVTCQFLFSFPLHSGPPGTPVHPTSLQSTDSAARHRGQGPASYWSENARRHLRPEASSGTPPPPCLSPLNFLPRNPPHAMRPAQPLSLPANTIREGSLRPPPGPVALAGAVWWPSTEAVAGGPGPHQPRASLNLRSSYLFSFSFTSTSLSEG